jgi:hypothetical protein
MSDMPSLRHPLAAAAALAAALALAAPAAATEVLVAGPDGVRTVDDPALPASELPPVPAGAARAARVRRAQDGPTVPEALQRLVDAGQLAPAERDAHLATYDDARSLLERLEGARRAEVAEVLRVLEAVAATEQLTASRVPALFLTLARNAEWWRTRPFPASGARVRFGSDPVTFQYYRGRGLQVQPLANFGRANALYSACVTPRARCRADALRALLDRMLALAARRGDFLAWEYLFEFGGGEPPWTSGMSQGTAVQALARAASLLGEPRYAAAAVDALGAFEQPPPLGVAVPSGPGRHYLLYSFAPGLRVLNGFLQATIGLHDMAVLTGDARARALFDAGDAAARAEVPAFDTGAWSLYSLRGRESDLSYHRLVRDFLRNLCGRVAVDAYCGAADRFTRYLSERPRVGPPRPARRLRARRTASVRFSLSKVSQVRIAITRGSRTVLQRSATLPYGTRSVRWRPAAAGRYLVRIEAADLAGNRAVRRARLVVRR